MPETVQLQHGYELTYERCSNGMVEFLSVATVSNLESLMYKQLLGAYKDNDDERKKRIYVALEHLSDCETYAEVSDTMIVSNTVDSTNDCQGENLHDPMVVKALIDMTYDLSTKRSRHQ